MRLSTQYMEIPISSGALVWNLGLTAAYGMLIYFARTKLDELKETQTLLAATREEVARNSITRAEFNDGMRSITDRLNALNDTIARNGCLSPQHQHHIPQGRLGA